MEKSKTTCILMAPSVHTRLKIAAVKSGLTLGGTIEAMLDKLHPVTPLENIGLSMQEYEQARIGKK